MIFCYLFFINDIADNVLGLCRLLVDGISVGERSFGLDNLRSIVTIDLKIMLRIERNSD